MQDGFIILSKDFFQPYIEGLGKDWDKALIDLKRKADFSSEDFEYYLIASALYSSKIEGNTLDADSFFRNRDRRDFPKKKEVAEIENLVEAYRFASGQTLDEANFLKAHGLLSKNILPANQRGKYRKEQVGIRDAYSLRPVYLAVEPEFVSGEIQKLFQDIGQLKVASLTSEECFYFASLLHIWLAKIHPFMDGNGRAARLLEKWFLSIKLGQGSWSVPSEKYYWDNRPQYNQNIALGYNYYALHWERCLPFLWMLPKALNVIPLTKEGL